MPEHPKTNLRIRNWNEFQHFKNRTPPWIKLHRTILERRDITMISDCSFRVLIGLWLLASEDKQKEGRLPPLKDIAFRLRVEEPVVIKALEELSPFLEPFDITMISERYQVGPPEKSRDRDRDREEVGLQEEFDQWWEHTPRKIAKGNARKAFKAARKKAPLADLIAGIKKYASAASDPKYIKHPATWLNGECWLDRAAVRPTTAPEAGTPEAAAYEAHWYGE